MTPTISSERLLRTLGELAQIGGRSDGGVDRVAGSVADREAREWLVRLLQEAGFESRMDADTNVFGREPGSSGPWLLAGSHTDTVPAGGRLDGAYGVVAAVEVLRTLHDAGHPAARAIEVVSFADEEGVASAGLTGSRALCATEHARRLRGYLEIHIEQGPRLESEGLDLGVVTGIVGIDRCRARVNGAANHAGTTPFAMRRDAGRAAAAVIARVPEIVRAVDPEMVANVGQVEFRPGAPNVVPGEAEFLLELRAMGAETMSAAQARVREALVREAERSGCRAELLQLSQNQPARMDVSLVAALGEVCDRRGYRWRTLVSGAGHDAGAMAACVPSAMLFVPSRGGISHSPLERTPDAQLVLGAQALLECVLQVLDAY